MTNELIERAIESAKCRIYYVRANVGQSLAHRMKADNQAEIQQVTIEALEKQISKKVIEEKGETFALTKDGEESYVYRYRCPSCNRIISFFEANNFCMFCGQKIDWSEEE